MTTPIIEVRNLSRNFGKLQAVRDISFDILPGQVVGFIGANGAGKTTTMRMMATLELPSAGSISICGNDVLNFPNQVRRNVGWMPDSYGTYHNTTVAEYLDFYGRAFGFKFPERKRRVEEVMEFTDLAVISDRQINKLSKGMGQRLCLGRTLLHDPEVLILDEPAAGLDPKARIEFKNLVRLLAENGKTIFISSHILSELGEMCDTLLFIDAGKIVHHGSSESLLKQTASTDGIVDVQVAGPPELLHQWVAMHPGVRLVEATRLGARLRFDSVDPVEIAASLKQMINDGVPVVEFHREERRLEEAFVDMLKKLQGN
jgi:ABC-2 type transport system ATP-binding protein